MSIKDAIMEPMMIILLVAAVISALLGKFMMQLVLYVQLQ